MQRSVGIYPACAHSTKRAPRTLSSFRKRKKAGPAQSVFRHPRAQRTTPSPSRRTDQDECVLSATPNDARWIPHATTTARSYTRLNDWQTDEVTPSGPGGGGLPVRRPRRRSYRARTVPCVSCASCSRHTIQKDWTALKERKRNYWTSFDSFWYIVVPAHAPIRLSKAWMAIDYRLSIAIYTVDNR